MVAGIVETREVAETLAYWATTSGIVIAVIAGLGALWKHSRDRRDREWDRAREAYAKFMTLTLEYPQFYPGFWSSRDPDDLILTNQFEWYISHFLWACEDVLVNHPTRDEWRESLKLTIASHADYFSSEYFVEELTGYYKPVRDLIREAIMETGEFQSYAELTRRPSRIE